MALTINTHPAEVITNAPEFDVSTSLSEGASYQELRIRATVYVGGQASPVAVLEQAKGLDDWDLTSLLHRQTGKCNIAPGGSDVHLGPNMGSELLTAWTNYAGGFSSWSTSGRRIISASSTPGASAQSNDLGTMDHGEVFVVGVENDYADTGTPDFFLELDTASKTSLQAETKYAGLTSGKLNANHIYFLMAHETTGYVRAYLTAPGSTIVVTGTFTIHKITDHRNNPGAYFHVKFEEVYENAAGVTTIGAESWSDTLLYMPVAVRPSESFTDDYIINSLGDNFLTRAGDMNSVFKYGIGMELRVMYAAVSAWVRASIVVDAGSETDNDIPNAGWGIIAANSEGGYTNNPDADDETIGFVLTSINFGSGVIYAGASMNINCETDCYPNMKALNFVGELGEETILFRGLGSKIGTTEKAFYKNANRIRKVLKTYKRFNEVLRTVFETEDLRMLLHELINTEKEVWMNDSNADVEYTEVTVITDETPISDKEELIESEIEIEYYE